MGTTCPASICRFLVCWSLTASRCDCRPCLWCPAKLQQPLEQKKNSGDLILLLKRWSVVIVWLCCCCSWSGRTVVFSGKLQRRSGDPTVTVYVLFSLFCFCFRYCWHGQPVSGQFWSSSKAPRCFRRCSGMSPAMFFFPIVVLQQNSLVDHVESDRCC